MVLMWETTKPCTCCKSYIKDADWLKGGQIFLDQMGPFLKSAICLFAFLQSWSICTRVKALMCIMSLFKPKRVKTSFPVFVCMWWECLRRKEQFLLHTLSWECVLLSYVSPSRSLQGKMESFTSAHHLLACIAASFLFDWHVSPDLTWRSPLLHLVFAYWINQLLSSFANFVSNDKFVVFLRDTLSSLCAAGDIGASGFNLAHLHSRERKQDMFLTLR